MSSHEGKKREKQKENVVRRGFRSLSFRHSKKTTKSTDQNSRHRHSASGLPQSTIAPLQRVQNCAARILTELTNNNNSSGNASPICSGIALLPFTAILPCDLSFKAGDRIDILTQTENWYDWWEGRLNGKTGIFPANYIKVLH